MAIGQKRSWFLSSIDGISACPICWDNGDNVFCQKGLSDEFWSRQGNTWLRFKTSSATIYSGNMKRYLLSVKYWNVTFPLLAQHNHRWTALTGQFLRHVYDETWSLKAFRCGVDLWLLYWGWVVRAMIKCYHWENACLLIWVIWCFNFILECTTIIFIDIIYTDNSFLRNIRSDFTELFFLLPHWYE